MWESGDSSSKVEDWPSSNTQVLHFVARRGLESTRNKKGPLLASYHYTTLITLFDESFSSLSTPEH